MLPISRKQTKRAEIAERYSLQAVTEVACELWQNNVVPQMIIRSPNVRPGEFAIGDAKRLLQHNPIESGLEHDWLAHFPTVGPIARLIRFSIFLFPSLGPLCTLLSNSWARAFCAFGTASINSASASLKPEAA